jgi:hypothetical protein
MQKLYIAPTKITPEILLSPDESIFNIKGISSPEDVRALYYPVIEWIKIFVDDIFEGAIKHFNQDAPLIMVIDLSYFNSSSAKFLFDILSELKRLKEKNIPLVVKWVHETEDTDAREAGVDFSILVDMEFDYVEKPATLQ